MGTALVARCSLYASLDDVARTVTSDCDLRGCRTRITHPDGKTFEYDYHTADRLFRLFENGTGPCWPRSATTASVGANGSPAAHPGRAPPTSTTRSRGSKS